MGAGTLARRGGSRGMKQPTPKRPSAKIPRGRRTAKPVIATANKPTTAEFEREDMGIAPKE